MTRGIYIVSNDLYANQLISLLNSLEANWPDHPPVCIIPYDSHDARTKLICKDYKAQYFDNQEVLDKVDSFFTNIWKNCPKMTEAWKSRNKQIPFRLGGFRRFLGSLGYGLFDEFLYLDADIYVNQSLECLFERLKEYDIVAHDWQHTGPDHIFNITSPILSRILNGPLLDQIQCSGMIVSTKTTFSQEEWDQLTRHLEEDQDVLYPWAPIQSTWCYMLNKYKKRFINLVRTLPRSQVTRDSQTYTKFEFKNGKLFDSGKEILYFHHIGVPSEEFNRICQGKLPRHNFRYQEVFKYFRYLDRRSSDV